MQIISRIWLLGGWFYLSLFFLIFLSYFGRKRLRKKVDTIVILLAAFFVLFVAVKSVIGNFEHFSDFWQPVDKKLDIETKGQAAYATHLKKILPQNAKGCIYFSFDMQTWYLQNQLYPLEFSLVEENADMKNCGLLISQFRQRTNSDLEELDKFDGNYLYRVKSNVF